MLNLTTSNDSRLHIHNKANTISLQIMCSEIEDYNQYCKESISGEFSQIPVQSLSGYSISDYDMDALMKWLESRDGLSNWVGIGGGESFSTELAGNEIWYNAKNKSATIRLWFREFEYELFEESNYISIDFENHDGNGSLIISDPEMNQLIEFFRSLDKIEFLKNET